MKSAVFSFEIFRFCSRICYHFHHVSAVTWTWKWGAALLWDSCIKSAIYVSWHVGYAACTALAHSLNSFWGGGWEMMCGPLVCLHFFTAAWEMELFGSWDRFEWGIKFTTWHMIWDLISRIFACAGLNNHFLFIRSRRYCRQMLFLGTVVYFELKIWQDWCADNDAMWQRNQKWLYGHSSVIQLRIMSHILAAVDRRFLPNILYNVCISTLAW